MAILYRSFNRQLRDPSGEIWSLFVISAPSEASLLSFLHKWKPEHSFTLCKLRFPKSVKGKSFGRELVRIHNPDGLVLIFVHLIVSVKYTKSAFFWCLIILAREKYRKAISSIQFTGVWDYMSIHAIRENQLGTRMDGSSLISGDPRQEMLVREAAKGDLEAFNHLVLAYQNQVYNLAYRLLGEHQAAEDAAQTAFISAYKNLGVFRGGSFKAWLLRIVINACYDELRRWNAHPTIPLEPVNREGSENENPSWVIDNGLAPEEYVEKRELESFIRLSLEKISLPYREVLILVDMQGLSYAEAADSLGKPVGTVKSRLARGRMFLGMHLKAYWEILPDQYRATTISV